MFRSPEAEKKIGLVKLDWKVGHTKDTSKKPEKMVPAQVPGAVQLDWAKANDWSEPGFAYDTSAYTWMEDECWVYSTVLNIRKFRDDERLYFISKGIDYRFRIVLDGKVLHEQEGMFTKVELDLTGVAHNGSVLEVQVFPVPKSTNPTSTAAANSSDANQSCKPAVSYGWDFHPRLVPSGIWDDTFLCIMPAMHVRSAEVFYHLSPSLDSASVKCNLMLSGGGPVTVHWRLLDKKGNAVLSREEKLSAAHLLVEGIVEKPQLWWPNGQGEAYIYKSEIEIRSLDGTVLDKTISNVGFRTVKLVMAPGQWDDPEINKIPKGPNKVPITIEINGRQIFCKGSNWVSPDMFPGRVDETIYSKQLNLVKDANMNLLRCWGGAIVQKDAFFDLADELGILIWQEFPLACNRYEGTDAYLKTLDQESRSIIKRLRQHPSVVIWCGGNELFNPWSKMTEQDHAIRLLNHNCYELDRDRPFLMTSPSFGMGHGWYSFTLDNQDCFQLFQNAKCTAYTEFGIPAPASVGTLKKIIPEKELYPPREGTAWQTHHGLKAFVYPYSWLEYEVILNHFPYVGNLEQLVEAGQLLQGEGLKAIFEETRRQKPRCSMALNWCLNEPWPTAANNSIISWPCEPKPGYKAVASACRPVLASLRIPKFRWHTGELFTAQLWVLNDSPGPLTEGEIEVYMEVHEGRTRLCNWNYPGAAANTNLEGPSFEYPLPYSYSDRPKLVVIDKKRKEMNSEYWIILDK